MKFELTILGTSAAVPFKNRYLSGQVLTLHDQVYLIDCGEGTQFRMMEYHVKRMKINQIFISHLHGDHFFGLFGVLTSMAMNGRKEPIDIFAPRGIEDILEVVFKNSYYQSPFPIRVYEVPTDNTEGVKTLIFENEKLSVYAFPLAHRVPCSGYLFQEKPLLRNMIADKITEYKIPFESIKAIKNGADFVTTEGVVIPNRELTLDPLQPRSYAYCSDTAYSESIIESIRGVNLLYHEATFGNEMAAHASMTGHSTALEAGKIAEKAEVQQLIIGHFSSRYEHLDSLLNEAKTVFSNTLLAIDGATYSVEML